MHSHEDFPMIQKLTFDLIALLSKADYDQFLEIVDSNDMKKEETMSDLEYLTALFSDIDIDNPYLIPYPEEQFSYYERLDKKGYALDCQLMTNKQPNPYIINLQFMKQPPEKEFTILLDGIRCSDCP